MTPSKFQIYRSHFFLNFLCGVLYLFIGYIVFSIPIESLTTSLTYGMEKLIYQIAIVTPVVVAILVLIQVNRISYKRFKQYNIKISRIIYPTLTYVGFTMPFAILLLILVIMHSSSPDAHWLSKL